MFKVHVIKAISNIGNFQINLHFKWVKTQDRECKILNNILQNLQNDIIKSTATIPLVRGYMRALENLYQNLTIYNDVLSLSFFLQLTQPLLSTFSFVLTLSYQTCVYLDKSLYLAIDIFRLQFYIRYIFVCCNNCGVHSLEN